MPIDDIMATQAIKAYGGQKNPSGKHSKSHEKEKRASSHGHEEQDFDDETRIMGIAPDELTPAVRHAIERLMAEIETLRSDIQNNHVMEQLMNDAMDHH